MTRDYTYFSGCTCPSCKRGKLKEKTIWDKLEVYLVCSDCNFRVKYSLK
jgi:hypothetical protein